MLDIRNATDDEIHNEYEEAYFRAFDLFWEEDKNEETIELAKDILACYKRACPVMWRGLYACLVAGRSLSLTLC